MKAQLALPMLITRRENQIAATAFSLIEVLVMVAVIVALAAVFLRPAGNHKPKAQKIKCVNNLKNVGLAFRIFATDNADRFPMGVFMNEGGSSEFTSIANGVYGHFLAFSNELNILKIVVCPSDFGKTEATNFLQVAT